MGRDRRGHRHGRRGSRPPAGPVGPQSAVRREGALDPARGAGDDSRCDTGSGRAAGGPFQLRPTTTLWRGPGAQPTRSTTSAGPSRGGLCRSSAAVRGGRRPFMGWSASDFSFAISLPGRTFATPAIPPCRMPGRSRTSRCGPGTRMPKSCWGFGASPIPCGRRRPRSICLRRRRFRRTTSRWSTIWQVAGCIPTTADGL